MSTFHELHAAAQTADTVVCSANDRDVLPDLTLLEFEDLMDLRVSGVGFPELAKRDISVPDADPGSPVADLALLSIEELMDLSVSTPSDDEPEADPDKEESTVPLHRGSATAQPFVFAGLSDWLNLSPAAFEILGPDPRCRRRRSLPYRLRHRHGRQQRQQPGQSGQPDQ